MPSTSDVLVSGLEFYTVSEGKPVELRVTVGDGQPGGTSFDCAGQTGQIVDDGYHAIDAAGSSLAGAVLHCVTAVKDTSDLTDRTSVTYTLRGGPIENRFPFHAEARQDRGLVIYSIRFFLMAETG